MDTAQWAQGIGSMSSTAARSQAAAAAPPTESAQSSSHQQQQQQQLVERRVRPVKEQALPCPRCNSTNTKFCYYNNYSLTQPRYFCKTCRRYWTEGGSLRNVPVGGGSRKNKRHSSSATTKANPNMQVPPATITSSSLPISAAKPYQGQDLNMAYPDQIICGLNFPGNSNGVGGLSAMELLRSTGMTPRGLGPLGMHMSMPMPETSAALYGAAGFGLHDFKFPLDGNGNGHGHVMQEGGGGGVGGRLLFPFGDLKQVSQMKSSNEISDQENRVRGEQAIFWSGAHLGGNGGSW